MFFLEAKKPSVDIVNDKLPAFQLKRYAWSGKLILSVLTDFEHLAIYEAKSRPKKNDSTKIGRVKLYPYKEYIDKWDEIYDLLSKDAVLKGSFNRFAKEKTKKGSSQVDDEFLKEIENWRLILARNIAIRNKDLSVEDLNYAVQLTIDRLIFLRIAEDRGIEPYKQLFNILDNENIYEEFGKLCYKADAKYNSGLFHFKEEKLISQPADIFTLKLSIDNGIFKEIIKNLYYPNSPYEFSVLSPEILGNVYEQFLGKIIRLTKGHQAKIEEKVEVKKAGGVFYTPQYIVDYIVENTIGKLCKDKTPNQVAKLKIVDPACGSGSFLLGAYNYLLKWHIDYYSQLEKPPKNTIYQSKNGKWHLTIQKKKEILLNNIYGVDIDFKAVEVSKLSLLLKVLEDENKDALEQQQKLIQERVLPYLGDNVRCGNSLIATDILHDETLSSEEIANINPFDWEEEFPAIFENGGFDVAIGNPPYFNIQTLGAKSKQVKYIKEKYEIWMDKSDILFYFIAKSIQISKHYVSFIISNAFLFSNKGKKLRNYILNKAPIADIVNFENFMVFKAGITTAIAIFDKSKKNTIANAISLKEKNYSSKQIMDNINNDKNWFEVNLHENEEFALIDEETKILNQRIDANHPKLGEIFLIGKGMETAADKIFSFKEYPSQFPKEFIKLRVSGKNSSKYFINENSDYILYFEFIEDFKKLPSEIQEYLKENKHSLKNRATVKNEGRTWWRYSRPMHKEYYDLPKLFCSRRASENVFSMDEGFKFLSFSNMTVIFGTNDKISLKYALAILNSKLLNFRYKSIGKQTGGGIYEYFPNGVSKLPIPEIVIDEQKPFIELSDKMIQLNKDLANSKTPHEKKLIEKQIIATNKKIDKIVYELYGLNEEEIAIVENSFNP
ncbi:MAG: BREX-1 system adenine-specific DNA-methyltransferase PglX [Methanobrevibacter sp.]|nr:BREX-1 system adenine-specific DNA-methyltransferase PglX [Methanobrevibacter sp.]